MTYVGVYESKNSQYRRLPSWTQPPECFENNIFSVKSDMFMFGLLLWELFNHKNYDTPQPIFMSLVEYRSGLKNGKAQNHLMSYLMEGIPPLVRELIERCLVIDRIARPSSESALEVLKDPYGSYESPFD